MDKEVKKELSLMERFGVKYLKRLRKKNPLERIDEQGHILDKHERSEINKISRRAIINVTIAGIISSLISGFAGFLADPLIDASTSVFSKENIWYWGIVLGVTIIATLFEIFYIYYDMMVKTHALTKAAHIDLFIVKDPRRDISSGLVRAALELPNRKKFDINIDPRRESSKIIILLATIMYKLKISVTNFILKAMVRRMMGRAISRAWLNFLAVPVVALWNAVVCWLVIREVKIRLLGPSAANEVLNQLNSLDFELSSMAKLSLLRAVGSCIVKTADLHPNLEYLYRTLDEKIPEHTNVILDDSRLFLADLPQLKPKEQKIVLRMLVYAAILDGKITFREKRLLVNAFKACKVKINLHKINLALTTYKEGKLVDFNIDVV